MSDTPRTDLKVELTTNFRGISEVVPASFARQLERELNEWCKCAEQLNNTLIEAMKAIQMLIHVDTGPLSEPGSIGDQINKAFARFNELKDK